MSYPKIKVEQYAAIGGINQKVSIYLTDDGEFLNLQNVDFRTVGSLSSFAGSTLASISGSTSPVNSLYYNYLYDVNAGGGSALIVNPTYMILATDSNNLSNLNGGTFLSTCHYVYPNNKKQASWATANVPFFANGYDFAGIMGSTITFALSSLLFRYGKTIIGFSLGYQYSLPPPLYQSGIVSHGFTSYGVGGLSGTIFLSSAFVRKDGFIGPASVVEQDVAGVTSIGFRMPGFNTDVGSGVSTGSFGISGIFLWFQYNDLSFGGIATGLYNTMLAVGDTQYIRITEGFTATGNFQYYTTLNPEQFQGSFLYGPDVYSFNPVAQSTTWSPIRQSYNPTILAEFANRLFMGGFYNQPNRVIYSDPGTPEVISFENFFDVDPTNTGSVTALKPYFTQLAIGKDEAFYALSGSSPDTFVLTQVSDIYGVLSHRAICIWEQNCWFIDRKGICEFNGANVKCISDKVQPIFDRMNVAAAVTEAVMVHVKERNEVWCAIPIDGSSYNNIIVIWDYTAKAWTTRTCPPGNMTALSVLKLGNNKQAPYYGNFSGMIGNFGNDFTGDNGAAFTSIIKTKFFRPFGSSVENVFRRLYLDATVPPGTTYTIPVNLYADGASTPSYQTTMVLSQFQLRIDFGLAAKAMAVEFIYSGLTALQFNGFTIETRFQRSV